MDKKFKECSEKLRKLVSDIQGAPYPGNVDDELYYIWYEHVQRNAMECYEFLDEYFPTDQKDISKALDNIAD
ncbi:MAG: hypothetical protein IJD23_07590 [Spirochaetaceae bacterium]|nr:hypothetical protein [Spirochaetaceae bacterium]MBQ3025156.1 hypothetical protein [Spirochaetaceae bacterium]MBQ7905535.1 hypothetical protein [Spirochaetaceae bacterium]